jgi:cytochrome c553
MFDIAGILALIGAVVLFGFLTIRAWKSENMFLKWIGVFVGGLLTLIPLAMLVLALVGFAKLNGQHDNPVADVQVSGSPAQLARGEQLAHICTSCHSPGNELPLSGSNFAVKFGLPPLGTFYAANLTPSGNIAAWSDGEVIRAIREGVHKDGRSLLVMPSANFRSMSDEDVQALVAYLRSQPGTGDPTPDTRFNVLGAIFMNLADFRTAQQPVGSVAAPAADPLAQGEYMVDIMACRDCHGEQLQGKVADGKPGPTPGPNLTKIVPQWTEDQFMTFFNTGTLPGGGQVPTVTLPSGFTEPVMPWPMVRAAATDEELQAMYAYLHSLSPVEGPAN